MAKVRSSASSPATVSLIDQIRRQSGLSQAELARRAGIPRSVLNAYLHGSREPGADALLRVTAAAGMSLRAEPRKPPVDPERASRILVQVLELAEALPFRPRAEMHFPPLAQQLAKRGVAA
ncbi:MAG TPA: helix-turn-helix transcriptional regulator [Solirubrobacterales bacterium]|nr:helix-turn-helix transcriptional regulator [Solirubrobacterales bacterium]